MLGFFIEVFFNQVKLIGYKAGCNKYASPPYTCMTAKKEEGPRGAGYFFNDGFGQQEAPVNITTELYI
jgi:hypothetical protein